MARVFAISSWKTLSVKDCNVTWLFGYVKLIENVIHIQVEEMSSTIQFVSSFFNDRNDVPSALNGLVSCRHINIHPNLCGVYFWCYDDVRNSPVTWTIYSFYVICSF